MANKSKTAFENMKYEIANQVGVNLKQGYNGDLTSRDAGKIGGNIVKKVFEAYTGTTTISTNSNKVQASFKGHLQNYPEYSP